jgi:hypothetical protein
MFASGICWYSHAADVCWIERVERQGEGVQLFIREDYVGALQSIQKADGAIAVFSRTRTNSFALKEGESASLTVLHSFCTASAVKLNETLAVEFYGVTCLVGFPCDDKRLLRIEYVK